MSQIPDKTHIKRKIKARDTNKSPMNANLELMKKFMAQNTFDYGNGDQKRTEEQLMSQNLKLSSKLQSCQRDNEQLRKMLAKASASAEDMELLYSKACSQLHKEMIDCDGLDLEMAKMKVETQKQSIKTDLTINDLDTKTRLLKEALTKKNNEVNEIEENNQSLVQLLEQQEEEKQNYDQEIEVLRLKIDKYEILLDKKEDKIDTDTLDGRVTFLVNLLEEYKKRLEEDVRREQEEEGRFQVEEKTYESLLNDEESEVYHSLNKQNSA